MDAVPAGDAIDRSPVDARIGKLWPGLTATGLRGDSSRCGGPRHGLRRAMARRRTSVRSNKRSFDNPPTTWMLLNGVQPLHRDSIWTRVAGRALFVVKDVVGLPRALVRKMTVDRSDDEPAHGETADGGVDSAATDGPTSIAGVIGRPQRRRYTTHEHAFLDGGRGRGTANPQHQPPPRWGRRFGLRFEGGGGRRASKEEAFRRKQRTMGGPGHPRSPG